MDDSTNKSVKSLTKKSVGNVPTSDVDFLNVAKVAAAKWAQTPAITLLWIDVVAFQTLVSDYETSLSNRKQAGSVHPQYIQKLKTLDKVIDISLSFVKAYLFEKYGKDNVVSYYPEFGIEKVSKLYMLPKDRNTRLINLNMLLAAIDTHGFTNFAYGKSFWEPILVQYTQLMDNIQQNSAAISVNVGGKNNTKDQIKEVLNALVLLLKANYPQTSKSELRNWGFQKEKY